MRSIQAATNKRFSSKTLYHFTASGYKAFLGEEIPAPATVHFQSPAPSHNKKIATILHAIPSYKDYKVEVFPSLASRRDNPVTLR